MKSILLVEDDELLGTLYSDLLKNIEADVTLVKDGLIAYKNISEGSWDLILLDVILPSLNALEILTKLKTEFPEKLRQKIVILSNLADDNMVKELQVFGFEILNKSRFNPQEFIAKIKSLL